MCKDIDIIIYWVDGNDELWKKDYSLHKGQSIGRFRDLGILKYVFRSIDKNLPWVRYIHFITNGQKPEWLDVNNEKIKFHTHKDIFLFKDSLPVFNSSAIEANFSNIPGLSEKFIIFNDDMLVLKPTLKERFFENNLPVDYLKLSFARKGIIYNYFKPENNLACQFINNAYLHIDDLKIKSVNKSCLYNKEYTLKTRLNNRFYSLFKKVSWIDIYHHPQAHLKSTWVDFFNNDINQVVKKTSYSKFRSANDINQYLYRFINLLNGKFIPREYKDHSSIYIRNVQDFDKKNIFDNRFLCICEDENMSDDDFLLVKQYLFFNLNKYFIEKSRYEK